MSDGSSFAQVQAALETVLKARAGLADVVVSQNPPATIQDLQGPASGLYDAIHIGHPSNWVVAPAFLGTPVTLDEEYDLEVIIQSLRFGTDAASQATVNARVAAMLGELVGALCSDPTLGISATTKLVPFDQLPTTAEGDGGFIGNGDSHGCLFKAKVHCHARLMLT